MGYKTSVEGMFERIKAMKGFRRDVQLADWLHRSRAQLSKNKTENMVDYRTVIERILTDKEIAEKADLHYIITGKKVQPDWEAIQNSDNPIVKSLKEENSKLKSQIEILKSVIKEMK